MALFEVLDIRQPYGCASESGSRKCEGTVNSHASMKVGA